MIVAKNYETASVACKEVHGSLFFYVFLCYVMLLIII